jgi:hypothetical protein
VGLGRMQQLWGNYKAIQSLLTRPSQSSEKGCAATDFDPLELHVEKQSAPDLLTGLKCIWGLRYIGGVYGHFRVRSSAS